MFNKEIPHIHLFNTPIHKLTMHQTMEIVDKAIQEKKQIHHVVVNAAKMVHMRKNEALRQSVIESNIINADGQAVVWASKALGVPLPERVAGIDLMVNLIQMAHEKKYKIFLFGAKEEVVKAVVDKYQLEFSPELIAGYRNGYYSKEDEKKIAKQIAASGADMLFVAITSPKKEIFLNNYKNIIQTPFIMGVGGSFDVVAGKTKRAPAWMQNAGLEWFYRLSQEPRRMFKRYFTTNSIFCYMLMKDFVLQRILGRKTNQPKLV